MFSHKSQNEFIERLQMTAHTYIDTYIYSIHTYVRACARTCTHTHTHTKEKQIEQAVLRYAQIFHLRPSSGGGEEGGGGGVELLLLLLGVRSLHDQGRSGDE